MNLYWVYDLSNLQFCSLMVAVAVAFGVVGLYVTQPLAKRIFGKQGMNDLVSYFLSATGVFYGITLGLIAVGTWENFNSASERVSQEAASLATLCQDARAMGDRPGAAELSAGLKEYLRYTIEDAWPVQRRGQIPKGGTERITEIHQRLLSLDPKTPVEQMVVSEMLERLNNVVVTRRLRLESVESGLPPVLWIVVVVGGAMNMSLAWMFVTERRAAHAVLVGVLGALVGLLIFMVAALDNPFRGAVSVTPRPFEILLDRYYK